MCGEYFKKPLIDTDRTGSPPHVWRIQILINNNVVFFGITSTCVENTMSSCLLRNAIKDHLHMCGEYLILPKLTIAEKGSPPHVWRIQIGTLQNGQKVQDHLHMCGEYYRKIWLYSTNTGSPPHVWRILSGLALSTQ